MADDKDKHSEEEADLERPSLPDTGELSLVEDDKPAAPPADDFDFDLDLDADIEEGDRQETIRALETRLMGDEYAEDFPEPEPEPETALNKDFTEHIEDEATPEQESDPDDSIEISIPEGAEVEVIEESYMDAPFVDEPEDPLEEYALNDAEEQQQEIEIDKKPRNVILQALAKPENAIKAAYRNSSLRQNLIENNEWYRLRDENQRMEEVLEQTYGGAADRGISIGKFVRNNILASALIVIALAVLVRFAVGIYFPDLLPRDDSASTGITTPKPASKKKTPGEKIVKVNYLNKAKIESSLDHCLILPQSREIFDRRFAKTGYEFSDKNLTLAHEELVGITSIYDRLDISMKVQDAVDRIGMLGHVAMPVIYRTRDVVHVYEGELGDMQSRADGIRKQLETLGIGRQDTAVINKQIKLRSDLDKLQDTLAKGPDKQEFARLEKALDNLDNGLTGHNSLRRIEIEEPEEVLPHWYTSLPDTDIGYFKTAVKESVLPEITLHANALSPDLAELSRFHVRELTILLEELYLVASQVMFSPENLLDGYNKDIQGSGKRLNSLLATDQDEWLSFQSCLRQARQDAIN